MQLRSNDFGAFFKFIHNCAPFPWQQALVNRLADSDTWPEVLDLPTGAGKTAALDASVFHLALRADAPGKAALRIALVVDRRLVVDDAFARARKIEQALQCARNGSQAGSVVAEVARRLQMLAGENGLPLVAQRLRGGAPLEHDWVRTPTQPTILCSTVDQVGSRLLFRGYGVSDSMKPVHAGLLGTDSLILLDEAHLAEPFRQTLAAIGKIGRAEIKVTLLSATPGIESEQPFTLSNEDRADPELRKRLKARKPALLKPPVRGGLEAAPKAFANEARAMAGRLQNQGVSSFAVGIVVNRVKLARDIFKMLRVDDATDAVLLTGRSRGVDRDNIAASLAPFHTGDHRRTEAKPLFVVATQCLEVGVDLDLDGLVTQAASLDALCQRFGRLNRAGRRIDAEGAIFALSEDIKKKAYDPVYGDRARGTWEALKEVSDSGTIDFGVTALQERFKDTDINPDDLSAERLNAPVLMPAYLDLWAQTSPRPTADPDIGLFLHGAKRSTAGVNIVWRSDIKEADLKGKTGIDLKELMRLVPVRAAETVELPIWVVRNWLRRTQQQPGDMSDAPEQMPDSPAERSSRSSRRAFRWAGHDAPNTGIIDGNRLRIGDTLVVPVEYGGCDEFGWDPDSVSTVTDVADRAAKPYWGLRCAVRISPDMLRNESEWPPIAAALAAEHIRSADLVELLLETPSTEVEGSETGTGPLRCDVREPLEALRRAQGRIVVYSPYAESPEHGVVLVAEQGIANTEDAYAATPATEDDMASLSSQQPVLIDDHVCRVARFVENFARTLHLGKKANDLRLAAYFHDAGKADPRFQIMLAGGDPWNRPDGPPLAKSHRNWSPQARVRAGLPRGWRHEALSVRMAQVHPEFGEASDPELVLWLIGSHHGKGRPFFNFLDSQTEPPFSCLGIEEWHLPATKTGPQSLAFDFAGCDWPTLFNRMKRRYGIWGLAHLEAILRLADHRASEQESSP